MQITIGYSSFHALCEIGTCCPRTKWRRALQKHLGVLSWRVSHPSRGTRTDHVYMHCSAPGPHAPSPRTRTFLLIPLHPLHKHSRFKRTLYHSTGALSLLRLALPTAGDYPIMGRQTGTPFTGENLDAVTAVTDSFKMADAFAGDRTGGAAVQTSTQTVDISVRQVRVWVNRLQRMYGSGWWVVLRA